MFSQSLERTNQSLDVALEEKVLAGSTGRCGKGRSSRSANCGYRAGENLRIKLALGQFAGMCHGVRMPTGLLCPRNTGSIGAAAAVWVALAFKVESFVWQPHQ